MTNTANLKNQSGQSLIQVVVAAAVGAILSLAVTTMTVNQSRDLNALQQRLASSDLERSLITALSNPNVGGFLTNGLKFNATKVKAGIPQSVTPAMVPPVYIPASYVAVPLQIGPHVATVGQVASSFSQSLKVASISLVINGAPSPFVAGPGQAFVGFWTITFSGEVAPLKPVTVEANLIVDTTVPAAAVITSYSGSSTGLSGITTNEPSPTIVYQVPGNFIGLGAPPFGNAYPVNCPAGYVMTGVTIFQHGTCGHNCDGDGIINSLTIKCTKLN